jgi:predicted nuclease of restriction endonuclease-like RecB superfamily
MPFALGDLKRSYGRSGARDGARDVRPYLLAGPELRARRELLAQAIDWYASRVGAARADVSADEFAQLVGDYQLARCLGSCLEWTFRFQALPFADAVHEVAAGALPARRLWLRLQEQAIDSPAALRLFVFGAVNQGGGAGFVAPPARPATLAAIAGQLDCTAAQLEALLWSDAPERERLVQGAEPPTPEALAAQYNRRAVETLLSRCVSADLLLAHPDGAAIKRLYFAVKRAGLLAELALADPAGGAEAGVWVHLFGPLEVFGPRTRHGDRFAAAVLELLRAFPEIQGAARVVINDRDYHLRLARGLGTALRWEASPAAADAAAEGAADDQGVAGEAPGAGPIDGGATALVRAAGDGTQFDSAVERHLYTTLRGMERRGDTRGWTVQREPEPIVEAGTVLVPDFVLERGPRRVFVEVVGFWTPAYRERKKAKLLAIAGLVDLVLVVQEDLASDFAGLPYAVLPYRRRPSAVDLVSLLERRYPAAGGEVAGDAIASQLRRLLAEPAWLDALRATCAALVPEGAARALEDVRAQVKEAPIPDASAAAEHLEALLPHAGFEIVWESLFDASVRKAGSAALPAASPAASPAAAPATSASS